MRNEIIERKIDELIDLMYPHREEETMTLTPELFNRFKDTLFAIRKMTYDRELLVAKAHKALNELNG